MNGAQDPTEAQSQVQDAEENLDPQQQQQLQQAIQQGRKLMQGAKTQADINQIAAINSGALHAHDNACYLSWRAGVVAVLLAVCGLGAEAWC